MRGIAGAQLSCFDNGSNRCLIKNKFAFANQLRSQKIKYRIKAVGVPERIEEAYIFIFELEDRFNKPTCVWAYGIDHIMPSPPDVNLSPVRCLFPHIPGEAFVTDNSGDVVLLIGNNFLGLHPSGGQGIDAAGNLRALQSDFGCG